MTDDEFLAARRERGRGAHRRTGSSSGTPSTCGSPGCSTSAWAGDAGGEATAATLRRIDAAHGGGKYHETITRFWLGLVWHASLRFAGRSFETVLAEHPQLLDGRRSPATTRRSSSHPPRRAGGSVAPDLEPVPWDVHAV